MNEVDRVMDEFPSDLVTENLALQQRIKTLELQLSIVTGDRAGLVEKLAEAYDTIARLDKQARETAAAVVADISDLEQQLIDAKAMVEIADGPDKELVLVLRIASDTSVVRHTYQMWGDIHSMNDMSWALNTIFLQDGIAASVFVYTKAQWEALVSAEVAK